MAHNWIEQQIVGEVNGKKISDRYFYCTNCEYVTKVIRKDGRINYLIVTEGNYLGKTMDTEPACLILINNAEVAK